ncbi:MAG: dienelactone hydrolase family protein [Ginsengibacter sp.]
MHTKNIITAGKTLSSTGKVLIMLHGRGADAQDILSLSSGLDVNDFTLMAPQATNNSWYPYSFLAVPVQNEPWLSSALLLLQDLVNDLINKDIPSKNIYILGFSQGACLTLEFVARNASEFGGVVAFTGGLIGDKVYTENYKGDFKDTPVFIGTSDPDPHVPIERVRESVSVLKKLNAAVIEKIYPNMGHMINQDEINNVNKFIFKS